MIEKRAINMNSYTMYIWITMKSILSPGEPNGPAWFGPLYWGVVEFGGAPGKFGPCGGAGPGVDDPEGAGEAVYCGVLDPGGPVKVAGLPWPPSGNTTKKISVQSIWIERVSFLKYHLLWSILS